MTKLTNLCVVYLRTGAKPQRGQHGRTSRVSKVACTIFVFCVAAVIASPAQTFKTLINFDGNNGFYTELMSLVQGTDGNFYGTTSRGGANDIGTVFKITSEGKLTTLHNFDNTDGAQPWAGLVQARDENFYGTTTYGGENGRGTVFKITRWGKLTTLHSFCSRLICADGLNPTGTLVQAPKRGSLRDDICLRNQPTRYDFQNHSWGQVHHDLQLLFPTKLR